MCGQCGGRPSIVFNSDGISGGSFRANKASYCSTIVVGPKVSGDPLPVHFQLKNLAQNKSRQNLGIIFFTHAKDFIGKFGWSSKQSFPCTWGLNEKAGMNAVELDKYFMNSILTCYPDVEDKPTKR